MPVKVSENKIEIIYIPIDQIKVYDNNPRVHSQKQIKQLEGLIKKYGFLVPIIIDPNNIINISLPVILIRQIYLE